MEMIANITMNVTATPNAAAENVTKNASIASSSAEKAAEKPAASNLDLRVFSHNGPVGNGLYKIVKKAVS